MKLKRTISFTLLLIAYIGQCDAQPAAYFVKRGNNISALTCSNIIFAPSTGANLITEGAGAVWVKKQLDLKNSFDISFYASYTDTTAEDGAAFVLQTDTNNLGASENGLGYRGINHSVAVTFDAIQNTNDNDPVFDHVAIQSNGDIDHKSSNNLAGPVSLEPYYSIQINTPYPPGRTFSHLINVQWDPATQNLRVLLDGAPLIAVQYDLIQKIFNGASMVYWGFTGSNTQLHPFTPSESLDVDMGSFSIFTGDDIMPRFNTQPNLDTCFGVPVTFIDESLYGFDSVFQGTRFNKWYWNFGDGTTSTLQNPPPHDYATSGTYIVRYTVANQTGCTIDTLIRKISLGAKPVADFSHAAGCVASPVTFTDMSSVKDSNNIIVTWKWNFNNEYTSESQKPVVNFSTTGTKTISLTVSSNYGCTGDTTGTILITDKPLVDFNFIQNCDALVNYNATLQNTIQPAKWLWQFGDNRQSAIQNPSHQFTANGVYHTLLLAYSDAGCPSDSVIKTITIDKLYPFAGKDTTIAAGQPLQLEASGGSSYEWIPATGLNNALIKDPIAILKESEPYVLVVHNAEGCEARDTINIKVYRQADLYVPNAFTPNGDGNNDAFRIIAPGITSVAYFKIYNRWGRMVFDSPDISKGWDGTINGQPQENGTYVWVIKATNYKGVLIEKRGTVTLIR